MDADIYAQRENERTLHFQKTVEYTDRDTANKREKQQQQKKVQCATHDIMVERNLPRANNVVTM